jgi:hypothetical protein
MAHTVDFRWHTLRSIPLLVVHVSGKILLDSRIIPAILDQSHVQVDHHSANSVYMLYDFTQTEGKLPLHALMQRTFASSKVKRVGVMGARTRADEMAMMIMATAKRLPYPIEFFRSVEDAERVFYAHDVVRY